MGCVKLKYLWYHGNFGFANLFMTWIENEITLSAYFDGLCIYSSFKD